MNEYQTFSSALGMSSTSFTGSKQKLQEHLYLDSTTGFTLYILFIKVCLGINSTLKLVAPSGSSIIQRFSRTKLKVPLNCLADSLFSNKNTYSSLKKCTVYCISYSTPWYLNLLTYPFCLTVQISSSSDDISSKHLNQNENL